MHIAADKAVGGEDGARVQTAGEYISILRRRKGLTMREAARACGLKSAGHWSDIENDKKFPYDSVRRIAVFFGVDFRALERLATNFTGGVVKFERGKLPPHTWRLVCEMFRRKDDLDEEQASLLARNLVEGVADEQS